MARLAPNEAYPAVPFRRRTLNWWARLMRLQPECIHLDQNSPWVTTYAPDTLYLRGREQALRDPQRPEVSLCLDCVLPLLRTELQGFAGRIVVFEPPEKAVTQYFYVAQQDFEAAGLMAEVAQAVEGLLARRFGGCCEELCSRNAKWLWIPQSEVSSLDDVAAIERATGLPYCTAHGAERLCEALANVEDANLFYLNIPYRETGAFFWI